ncbi:hypothetical protein PYW08_012962 [Mythimna loreyi]|uniref:Uncharacterized protein n=1 Tax=Mythimna loreyi TaxID=667449 RepID=A0ACC2Q1F2_9NEOP|nr:hypothetical protein PYW08_012962 [Mythimna loreyi]
MQCSVWYPTSAIERDLPPVPDLYTHIASIRQSNGTSLRYPSSTHTLPPSGNPSGPPSGTRSLHTHCLHPAIERDLPPVPVLNTHIASIRQSIGTSLRYPISTHTLPPSGNRTGPPSGTRPQHTHCLHPAIHRDLPPVPDLYTHIASIRQSNGTSLRYPSLTHTLPPSGNRTGPPSGTRPQHITSPLFSTFSDYLHCHAGVGHRAQVTLRLAATNNIGMHII